MGNPTWEDRVTAAQYDWALHHLRENRWDGSGSAFWAIGVVESIAADTARGDTDADRLTRIRATLAALDTYRNAEVAG